MGSRILISHSPYCPVVPPVPVNLSGLNPRYILQFALAAQHQFHLVGSYRGIVADNGKTPGQAALSAGTGNAVALFGDGPTSVATWLPCFGRFGMNGCKTIGARALKESVGIVAHIALGDKYLGAFGTFEQYWQIGYLVVGLILSCADVRVRLFVRGVEVASLRDVSLEGFGQMVVNAFAHDIYNTFLI